jgi:sulfur transfer complex TusBCD TusB component (DsrH family)
MKILTIVQSAYRATLEDQNTILSLSRALKNNGDDLTVLLRGNAVKYIVKQQCPVSFGTFDMNHTARRNEGLSKLREKGVSVYAIDEDLKERGIDPENCIDGVQLLPMRLVASLMDIHNQVWHW